MKKSNTICPYCGKPKHHNTYTCGHWKCVNAFEKARDGEAVKGQTLEVRGVEFRAMPGLDKNVKLQVGEGDELASALLQLEIVRKMSAWNESDWRRVRQWLKTQLEGD